MPKSEKDSIAGKKRRTKVVSDVEKVMDSTVKKRSAKSFNPDDVPFSRANIGARNLLCIALHLAGSDAPPDLSTEKAILKFIDKILKSAYDIAFNDLHDPKSRSPLYYGLSLATEKLCHDAKEKDNAEEVEYYEHILKYLSHDPARKTGAGASPEFCKSLSRSPTMESKIRNCPTEYRDKKSPNNLGIEFNDPVQGCVADCWFLSALSSVAWAELINDSFPRSTSKSSNTAYFWPVVASGKRSKYAIQVSSEYYLDDNKDPYYARTNSKMLLNPEIYQTWSLAYEKACAGYYERKMTPPFDPVIDPNYKLLDFKDPFGALSDLTGKQYTDTTDYTAKYLTNPLTDGSEIVEKLRNGICGMARWDPNTDQQFISAMISAVAYTYVSEEYVPDLANPVNLRKVTYDSPGVSANHAYSILGLYRKKENTGAFSYFLILRNPWGFAGTSVGFNADLKNGLANDIKTAMNATTPKVRYI